MPNIIIVMANHQYYWSTNELMSPLLQLLKPGWIISLVTVWKPMEFFISGSSVCLRNSCLWGWGGGGKLTINLILGLEASSAAPSEEVRSFGLLHEDHVQRTCRGSSRSVNLRRSEAKRHSDAAHLMGLSGYLCSGAQLQSVSPLGRLRQWTKDTNLNLEHQRAPPWHRKDPVPSDSQRRARNTARRPRRAAHVRVMLASCLDWDGEADREEMSLQEVWSWIWRNKSREGRRDWLRLRNEGNTRNAWK